MNKRMYVCPNCGKKAELGTHFCIIKQSSEDLEKKNLFNKDMIKYILSVFVVIVIIVSFVWPYFTN